jgi:hypothetical protein
VPRTTAGSRFFLDGTDNRHLPTGRHIYLSHSSRKGAQWALGIDRPPPIEPIPIPSHRQITRKGVDVAQQQHAARPIASGADGVTDRIHASIEAVGGHPVYQAG